MIYDHNRFEYRAIWDRSGMNRFNGAYYYSVEIVESIIPKVKTDRNWVTVNVPYMGTDHSIVFIHNNLQPERYDWLKKYKDLILVCGVPYTEEKVKHLGKTIYLPLSIDTEYVSSFRTEHTKKAAYVGRKTKRRELVLPPGIHYIEDLPRALLLQEMAEYKEVYAVGRTAIEARCLGCEIKAFDPRYPDPSIWKVVDNSEAAKMLQDAIDQIDKR